jgi:superfamily II DNA helicase RecQ
MMYSPPFSPVEFSQQAGRAGRNGQPATSVILYNDADLVRQKPAVDESMVQFIKDSNSKCLRKTLLEYLGDESPLGHEQSIRCCSYCNPELLSDISVDSDGEKGQNDGEGVEKTSTTRVTLPHISTQLKEDTREALETFRIEKARTLPEGSLFHGLASAVFGDVTLDKIVKKMREITTGDDVINICGGTVQIYAEEVAAIVCDMKQREATEKAAKKAAKSGRATRGRQKPELDPDFQKGLITWNLNDG